MKRPAAVLLFALALAMLVAVPSRGGEELPATVIDDLGRALEYFDVLKYYDTVFDGLLSKYQMCRARGFDEELCRSTYTYCAFNAIPVGGVAGAFIAAFELNQLFRVDCGDGTCYQCCYVPQNSNCHTSFVGFPVINCNASMVRGPAMPAWLWSPTRMRRLAKPAFSRRRPAITSRSA